MLCEKCGQHQATTHIQKTVAGVSEEHHLCASCAAQLGYSHFTFDIGDLWPSLFGGNKANITAAEKGKRCEGCGSSFADFLRTKRAGCSGCYTAFKEQLAPSLERMHGRVSHTGKTPRGASQKARAKEKLLTMKKEMAEAASQQDYERAALLRDEIKRMEEKVDENE